MFPGKGLKVMRSLDFAGKLQILVWVGYSLIQCMQPLKQQTILVNFQCLTTDLPEGIAVLFPQLTVKRAQKRTTK